MAVSIRLARIGKKKAPFYRIVATDRRNKRDGEFLENLGTYNPLTGELIQFHSEGISAWVSKGAIVSDAVLKLQRKHKKQLAGVASVTDGVAEKVKKTGKKAVQEAAQVVTEEIAQ